MLSDETLIRRVSAFALPSCKAVSCNVSEMQMVSDGFRGHSGLHEQGFSFERLEIQSSGSSFHRFRPSLRFGHVV